MIPVEHTRTSSASQPTRSARCSAVRWVSMLPRAPVQAFALPELRITARAFPSSTTFRDHTTGAATTRLRVNTPAAT